MLSAPFSMSGRHDLDFDVLRSPERDQERAQTERERLRARAIDDVYMQARARKYMGVAPAAADWLDACTREELQSDAPEFMRAALSWNDASSAERTGADVHHQTVQRPFRFPRRSKRGRLRCRLIREVCLLRRIKRARWRGLSGLAGNPRVSRKSLRQLN